MTERERWQGIVANQRAVLHTLSDPDRIEAARERLAASEEMLITHETGAHPRRVTPVR